MADLRRICAAIRRIWLQFSCDLKDLQLNLMILVCFERFGCYFERLRHVWLAPACLAVVWSGGPVN